MTTYNWEDLRALWVNGNLTDAKEALAQAPKHRILKIIRQALDQFAELDYQSGDLTDLREILHALTRI